jgi:AcrR family transcriptional regulator
MPRSGAPARARLREAALDLYQEQGYEATTTAQIAERAGVTERTYFRHFADKREVLFDGEASLRDTMVEAIETAPPGTAPLAVLQLAFVAAVPLFVAGRAVAERREPIIAVTPALQERALAKSAALNEAIAAALTQRGVPAATARLAAQVGRATFGRAMAQWGGRSGDELKDLIARSGDELRALTSG